MRPEVLVRVPFPKESIALLEQDFAVHYAPTPDELATALGAVGPQVRAVVTNGSIGLKGEHIRAMPKLEPRHRGDRVRVGRSPGGRRGGNSRRQQCRQSPSPSPNRRWRCSSPSCATSARPTTRSAAAGGPMPPATPADLPEAHRHSRLGEVGTAIARRAAASMRASATTIAVPATTSPTTTTPRCPSWRPPPNRRLLPGGPATRGLVNRHILDALGPSGYLINVGRGSVVDTDALVQALHERRIAGAGLDVWLGEPETPEASSSREPRAEPAYRRPLAGICRRGEKPDIAEPQGAFRRRTGEASRELTAPGASRFGLETRMAVVLGEGDYRTKCIGAGERLLTAGPSVKSRRSASTRRIASTSSIVASTR